MRKSHVEACAISGLPLDGLDVARVKRHARGVIIMRHAWRDSDDGRVLMAVSHAAHELARDLARKLRCAVEIYAPSGYMVDQVQP